MLFSNCSHGFYQAAQISYVEVSPNWGEFFWLFVQLLLFFWSSNWLDVFPHMKSYIMDQVLLPDTVLWGKDSSSTCFPAGLKADSGLLPQSRNNPGMLWSTSAVWKIQWKNRLSPQMLPLTPQMWPSLIPDAQKLSSSPPNLRNARPHLVLVYRSRYKHISGEVQEVTLAWQQCWGEA